MGILDEILKLAAQSQSVLGIPDRSVMSTPPDVKKPRPFEFAIQRHDAARAGRHFDIRLGDPETGIAFSWASRKELPKPGERPIMVYQQPDHTLQYMDFTGEIESGYGKGKVELPVRHQVEVYHADPNRVKFNIYEGRTPQELILRRMSRDYVSKLKDRGGVSSSQNPDGVWLLQNVTKTRDRVEVEQERPKYREIRLGDVDLTDDSQVFTKKIDGARVSIPLEAGRIPRIFSSRIPVGSEKVAALYFAYGSNLNQDQMRERLGDVTPDSVATLSGHKRVFSGKSKRWKGGVATIVPDQKSQVMGLLYRVRPDQIKELDRYEGAVKAGLYERVRRAVIDARGKKRKAFTYIKNQVEETLPSDAYLQAIQRAERVLGIHNQLGKEAGVHSTGLIEHTHKIPQALTTKIPDELDGTSIIAEVFARGRDGIALPSSQVGSILNSTVQNSRELQRKLGARMELMATDITKYRGKDVTGLPYKERLGLLQMVREKAPFFTVVPAAFTKAEKEIMLEGIRSGTDPDTKEGLVIWDDRGPIKAKLKKDYDLPIVGTFPGEGKWSGKGVGGLVVETSPGKTTRVGTGLTDEQRMEFMNPESWKSRVAVVQAQDYYQQTGRLRAPVFKGLHIEKFSAANPKEEQTAADFLLPTVGLAGVTAANYPLYYGIGKGTNPVNVEDIRRLSKKLGVKDLRVVFGASGPSAMNAPFYPSHAFNASNPQDTQLIKQLLGKRKQLKTPSGSSTMFLPGYNVRERGFISRETVSHELGHLSAPSKMDKAIKLLRRGEGLNRLGRLGATGAVLFQDPDSTLSKAAPYVAAAGSVPLLAEEARASVRGLQAARALGMSASSGPLLRAFGSHLTSAAVLPLGLEVLRQIKKAYLNRKDK